QDIVAPQFDGMGGLAGGGVARATQALELPADGGRRRAIRFDHRHFGRAPRSCFESQGAATREGIEYPPARQVLAEPVEEGLAHPVGRRAQSGPLGDLDRRSPPNAADDADRAHWPGLPGGLAVSAAAPGAPTTTVANRSGSIRRRNASRTCSSVTDSTRSIQSSSQSSGSFSSPISASWPSILAFESMRSAKPPTRFALAAASSVALGPSATKRRRVPRTTSSAFSVCALLVCRPTMKGPGCRIGMKYEYTLYARPRCSRTSS